MKFKNRFAVVSAVSVIVGFGLAGASQAAVIPGDFIVKVKPQSGFHALAFGSRILSQADVKELSESEGIYEMKLDPNAGITGEHLESLPGVEYAEPNTTIQLEAQAQAGDPRLPEQWSLPVIKLPDLLRLGLQAKQQVVVAVIDTGVDWTHPDLADKIYTNPREIDGNGIDDDGNGYADDVHGWNSAKSSGDSRDDHGHGTHCAGVIAAQSGNGVGIMGISQDVKILPVKFLDKKGGGTMAGAIAAVEYARKMKVQVMSNSWGGGEYSRALEEQVQAAEKDGILFVAAAGNESGDNDKVSSYPANFKMSNVVSVAATDQSDKFVVRFPGAFTGSNYGANSVHIGAPGVKILSTILGGKYDAWSGTSMAAPHVSGVAAVMLSLNPTLKPSVVRDLLMQTSDKLPDLKGRVISGGRVNALQAALAAQR